MFRLALLLLSVPLFAHGAEGIYHAAHDRQLTTVTCPEFMLAPPKARWLRVVGCDIDYTHPAFTASGTRVTEMFFAMRSHNEPPDAPVSLIVATRDPHVLAIAQQALGSGTDVAGETFTVAMLRVVDVLRAAREVDGYDRDGVLERLLTRRALAGFDVPLTSQAMVLDLHERPSFLRPGIEAGVAVLFVVIATALGRRRRVAVAEPPASQVEAPFQPEGAAANLERRLPPALLLNLDLSAEVSEIEYAPPLGDHREVAERISNILGPLTDEGTGKYSLGGSDWRINFDLGRDDVVWTVTVDVRGSNTATDALDRLARETNWRVFVPRLGTFR